MAKEVGTNRIQRAIGDACPRQCPGVLVEPTLPTRGVRADLLECAQCHYTFDRIYMVGPGGANFKGNPPELFLPDEIVIEMILAEHLHELAKAIPNPSERNESSAWFEQMEPRRREALIEEARRKLTPVWPMIAGFFGGVPNLAAARKQRDAVNAIREIAVPSLKYCEDKYGHDNQARVNLEAVVKET